MKDSLTRLIRSAQGTRSQRSMGDAARDQENWTAAADAYRAHLHIAPDDVPIWVQLGNCLKEAGSLDAAEAAYARAEALDPDDADLHLQIGHLLKLLNRPTEAQAAYQRSFDLKPTLGAQTELTSISDPSGDMPRRRAGAQSLHPVILIEVDDLLGFLAAHETLSGIQRVQAEVVQHTIRQALSRADSAEYVFVITQPGSDHLWSIDHRKFAELISYVTTQTVQQNLLRAMVLSLRSASITIDAQEASCYLVLGAFWWNVGSNRYQQFKAMGLLLGFYIYDLIPITHPEFCDAGLCHEFMLSFGDAMSVADFVLTISDYTAHEVQQYRDRMKLRSIPVKPVLLAHVMNDNAPNHPTSLWGPGIREMQGRSFVMIVSTIEARKNHAFLFSAWKRLVNEGLDAPDLVFVGRMGWRVNNLVETLVSSRYLDGRIHILHDISDQELQTLYDNCLFTVFPSLVEGWGLPVGESLARGKPCIASSTSSLPEVGGEFVDYIDPHNLSGALDVLRRMIVDHRYRDDRSAAIRARFKPRTWAEVTTVLLDTVNEQLGTGDPSSPFGALFPSKLVFRPGALAFGAELPADYVAMPTRLILFEGWYPIERFGVWARGNRATLRFRSELPPGSPVNVYLQLSGAPWSAHHHTLSIVTGGRRRARGRAQTLAMQPGNIHVRATGEVGDGGELSLTLTVVGDVPQASEHDARRFVVGLCAIGYASAADGAARAEITEQLYFTTLG